MLARWHGTCLPTVVNIRSSEQLTTSCGHVSLCDLHARNIMVCAVAGKLRNSLIVYDLASSAGPQSKVLGMLDVEANG